MFELLSGALFSISANIDNIPIGISYGIKKAYISPIKNIFICIITSIVTFFSMFIGENISFFFDIKFTNIIGAIFFIFLGSYSIIKNIFFIKKRKEEKIIYNKKLCCFNNKISFKETLTIILTLSLNNIATGFAASITGINIVYTTIFTFIFGTVFLYIGNNLGKKFNNNLLQKYSDFISSIILVFIGILELFI